MTDAAAAPSSEGASDTDVVARLPHGWTRVTIAGRPWGVTRTDHAAGRSSTFTADELGGPGYLSANIWRTEAGLVIRPCEVPMESVTGFLGELDAVLGSSDGAASS